MPKQNHPSKFTLCAQVGGALQAYFVFPDGQALHSWEKNELPQLVKKYGRNALSVKKNPLPGFQVGDTCCVYGEGLDKFKILSITKFEDHRYGFVLEGHGVEDVAKCFSPD